MGVARNFRNDVYAVPQEEEANENRAIRHAAYRQFDISCELQGLQMRNLQGIVLLYSPASLGDFQRSIIIRLSFQWKDTESYP